MQTKNQITGKTGESLATQYLANQGYLILEVNFSTPFGEIDIIAKHKEFLVFIEVKTRGSCTLGLPMEAVSLTKQKHIKNSAVFYCKLKKFEDIYYRFDVIEVFDKEINHIPNAF